MKSHDSLSEVGGRRDVYLSVEIEYSVRFRPLRRADQLGGSRLQQLDRLGYCFFELVVMGTAADELEKVSFLTDNFQAFHGADRKEVRSEQHDILVVCPLVVAKRILVGNCL